MRLDSEFHPVHTDSGSTPALVRNLSSSSDMVAQPSPTELRGKHSSFCNSRDLRNALT